MLQACVFKALAAPAVWWCLGGSSRYVSVPHQLQGLLLHPTVRQAHLYLYPLPLPGAPGWHLQPIALSALHSRAGRHLGCSWLPLGQSYCHAAWCSSSGLCHVVQPCFVETAVHSCCTRVLHRLTNWGGRRHPVMHHGIWLFCFSSATDAARSHDTLIRKHAVPTELWPP